MADAVRRARARFGMEAAVLQVREIVDERQRRRVEITVAPADRIGIPSMIEFLERGRATSGVGGQLGQLPARYRAVWSALVEQGVRKDQALILCQQAWQGDSELEATPWERVVEVLEQRSPCSAALDLSREHVLGLAGLPGGGRSSVGRLIAQMAAAILPDQVCLVAASGRSPVAEGTVTITAPSARDADRQLRGSEPPRQIVIDLPPARPGADRLGFGAWFDVFPGMILVPVVHAKHPLPAAMSLLNSVAPLEHMGWIMTGLDHDQPRGPVVSLAMASVGPFAMMGRDPDGELRLEIARWRDIVEQLHFSEEPPADAPAADAEPDDEVEGPAGAEDEA